MMYFIHIIKVCRAYVYIYETLCIYKTYPLPLIKEYYYRNSLINGLALPNKNASYSEGSVHLLQAFTE